MKWLFLVHQVQTRNSRERVKVWRLTKKVGAVLFRNSVYVLPFNKERLEDFQWLCQQIRDSQGEASVFISESELEAENGTLRRLFEHARTEDAQLVIKKTSTLLSRIQKARKESRLSEALLKSFTKELKNLDAMLIETKRIDFFGTPALKDAQRIIEQIRKMTVTSVTSSEKGTIVKIHSKREFQGRTWCTREHTHIDRVCSAWLIKHFIDPKAKFVFAPEFNLPQNAIPFDVFGAEFGHHGEDCTFETLLKAFRIKDKALETLAQIVHDIDLKDNKFGRSEASGLDSVIRGLSDWMKDDKRVLEIGSNILDALYARFSSSK